MDELCFKKRKIAELASSQMSVCDSQTSVSPWEITFSQPELSNREATSYGSEHPLMRSSWAQPLLRAVGKAIQHWVGRQSPPEIWGCYMYDGGGISHTGDGGRALHSGLLFHSERFGKARCRVCSRVGSSKDVAVGLLNQASVRGTNSKAQVSGATEQSTVGRQPRASLSGILRPCGQKAAAVPTVPDVIIWSTAEPALRL